MLPIIQLAAGMQPMNARKKVIEASLLLVTVIFLADMPGLVAGLNMIRKARRRWSSCP
jgi:hypothetical protein